ncbi:hypothetical protein SAMN05660649_02869 [Desulfotomaculum arcticum]|uniref:Uncharacterized protein n=1 Tax=Desulfotruncus arcticus DSM 17038 TaxID=1121424 RepID=A0A1I2V2Y6_9FIRM|nr:hypothetical protein SAMN05660649_02869 [Desulfotomaculum arcticum] [Desulfotruncus arcticus DSM 17038]
MQFFHRQPKYIFTIYNLKKMWESAGFEIVQPFFMHLRLYPTAVQGRKLRF